jgi:hypothetical protein
MPNYVSPPINPQPPTLASLQQAVLVAFQRLVAQLNVANWASQSANQPVDAGMNRVINVGDPATGKDAVNRDYVTKQLALLPPSGGAAGVNTTNVVVSATIQIASR